MLHFTKRLALAILFRTSRFWPDRIYLKMVYYLSTGEILNLTYPRKFNEKMNWLKLYNRNPFYTKLADKYEVKRIVADMIGNQYVVPTYGVYNSFDSIDFSKLPDAFILKTTHDSGGGILCKSKINFDFIEAKKQMKKKLKKNYYPKYREWPYKNIQPRIVVDKLLDDGTNHELQDYKFWCFNGVPKVIYLTNKGKDVRENFYDMDFNPLSINHGFAKADIEFSKPEGFEIMKELAAKLSRGIPFVRVDFFYVNGKVYFGEYTFYDWGGMQPFQSKEWDIKLGSWINLHFDK